MGVMNRMCALCGTVSDQDLIGGLCATCIGVVEKDTKDAEYWMEDNYPRRPGETVNEWTGRVLGERRDV